jgi:outer membrane protein TolC
VRRLGVLLAAASLSGCLVGPEYERPQPATPPTVAFKETSDSYFRPAQPLDSIDRGKWWSMYGDAALDQLAAQVDVSNQNLKVAEAAYRQAVALIRQSQSPLYPTIGYTGSISQTARAAAAAAARSRPRRSATRSASSRRRHAELGDRRLGPHPPHIESDSAAARRAPPT